MSFVLLGLYFFIFIFQRQMLKYAKKDKNGSFWIIYFTIAVAVLTSSLGVGVYCGEYLSMKFADYFWLAGFLGIVIFGSILSIIIGIISKVKQNKSIQEERKKLKTKFTFLKIIVTFVCTWGLIFGCVRVHRLFRKSDIEKYAEQFTINYMNNRYGDGDFKVINIKKEYTGVFFGETEEWKGFKVSLKSSYVSEEIDVYLEGTTKASLKVSSDFFIERYYDINYTELIEQLTEQKEKKAEQAFLKEFNISMRFSCYSYKTPENHGHIPTMEELVGLTKISGINITINDNLEFSKQLDYLKRLAQFSIKYFDTYEKLNISYDWGIVDGVIKIENDMVTIKLRGEKFEYTKEDILNYNS